MSLAVKSETLKSQTMNIRGVDLFFDETGTCQDVTPELAILIAPMPGFKVRGADEATKEAIAKRVEAITHEKNELKPGFVRGIPRASHHAAQPQGYVTNVAGRVLIPKSAPITADTLEKSDAEETVVTEEAPAESVKTTAFAKAKKRGK